MPKFQVQVNKCKVCEKTVYPMEELIADNDHYHKPCFRCNKCNRTLSTGSYASLDGAIFCKPHFLQLFKQKGNYEEGFGKERYKNKWNGPNSKLEFTSGGQAVTVKEPVAALDTDPEVKENVVNGSVAVEQHKAFPNGINDAHDRGHGVHDLEDSTDGVEEESGPISLRDKKSKLFEKPSSEPHTKQNTPGKLKSWKPLSSRNEDSATEKPKPAPKKLSINWSARTQERAAERADNEQPLKFSDMGDVKTKFESGDIGKKELRSQVSTEIIPVSHGKAQSAKETFENRAERQYDTTKKRELEELKIARTLAAQRKTEEDHTDDVPDSRVEEENNRYRELEEFKKASAAKQNLSKFESGTFSNVEQSEVETRKEVENILGSGKAADTLRKYEAGDYEKKEYQSPVKQELGTLKADTSTKKSLYESGGNVERQYESEAKKELETITAVAGETRDKFESGQLLTQRSQNEERVGELEEIRSVSATEDKKSKFESGELIRTDFDSDVRKEIETMKTGASEYKTKYESGELIRTEFDSDVKKELETMSTGAMDKKNKYETGDLSSREYDSVARKEVEEVKGLTSSSSIKSKYRDAVEEGNKGMTSKPVTIEKASPGEDPFLSRSEDEDFKVTTEDDYIEPGSPSSSPAMSDNDETEDANVEHDSPSSSPAMSDNDETEDANVQLGSPCSSPALSDADDEYVAPVEPKKMTNIEERFKKAEVEKPAPNVNKIKMPTFEKTVDSDEEVNGEVPDEEEAEALKEQMWPKKTSSIKTMFENRERSEEEPKEAPQPIDLRAEISDSDQDD